MDIQQIAQQKLQAIVDNGTVEKMVEDQVTKTLNSIIQDIFRDWGGFGKALKEVVEEKIQLNLSELKIDGYAMVVNQTIEKAINGAIAEEYAGKVQKLVQDTLGQLEKKEWKLSEICTMYYEEEIAEDREGYSLFLEVEEQRYNSIWIRIGKKSKKSSYSYSTTSTPEKEISIMIDPKTKKITGTWYQGKLTSPVLGRIWDHNLSTFLMKLWVEECTLDIDVQDADDVDTYDDND